MGTAPVKSFLIRKIDARNDLFGYFKWQIRMEVEEFLGVREWCYATWGPAVEYQWWNEHGRKRSWTKWSFDTRTRPRGGKNSTIYLQSDEELTLFHLKWQ